MSLLSLLYVICFLSIVVALTIRTFTHLIRRIKREAREGVMLDLDGEPVPGISRKSTPIKWWLYMMVPVLWVLWIVFMSFAFQ